MTLIQFEQAQNVFQEDYFYAIFVEEYKKLFQGVIVVCQVLQKQVAFIDVDDDEFDFTKTVVIKQFIFLKILVVYIQSLSQFPQGIYIKVCAYVKYIIYLVIFYFHKLAFGYNIQGFDNFQYDLQYQNYLQQLKILQDYAFEVVKFALDFYRHYLVIRLIEKGILYLE